MPHQQKIIGRIMETYVMMVDLSEEQKRDAEQRVSLHLKDRADSEQALVIEGLKFLRSPSRHRRRRSVRMP